MNSYDGSSINNPNQSIVGTRNTATDMLDVGNQDERRTEIRYTHKMVATPMVGAAILTAVVCTGDSRGITHRIRIIPKSSAIASTVRNITPNHCSVVISNPPDVA
jgi:hypothetical protein